MSTQTPTPLDFLPRVTVTEEIVYPRSFQLEEILRLIRDEKRTGSVTINFNQGAKCDVVWKHKRK